MKKLIDLRKVTRDLRHAEEHIDNAYKITEDSNCQMHLNLAKGIIRSAIAREMKSIRKSDGGPQAGLNTSHIPN